MVKAGGWSSFHDIVEIPGPEFGVHRFWKRSSPVTKHLRLLKSKTGVGWYRFYTSEAQH